MTDTADALWRDALATVLRHEGGYSDDPVDPGGATNFGISLRFLRTQGIAIGDVDQDGDIDAADVRALTRDQAAAIYRRVWWDTYGYARLPGALAIKIFDTAVNMGSGQAHKLLQRAVNVILPGAGLTVDGKLGPKSWAAIERCDPALLLPELRFQQAIFYLNLIEAKPAFHKYRGGWLRRAVS